MSFSIDVLVVNQAEKQKYQLVDEIFARKHYEEPQENMLKG
ncbi:hypothetical protein ACFFIF_10875 [Vagococcus entomophilus]|nr:hypothetical protein [Vagococcus entomophilus]